MPKGKISKKKGGKNQEGAVPDLRIRNEDEESMADNWSTASVLSDDSKSWNGSDNVIEEEAEDTSEQENFEDKFIECLDLTTAKSTQSRVNALKGLQMALQKKFVPDFLEDRKETVVDSLVRCLRKGKGEEQALSANCLALMALQLGSEVEGELSAVQSFLTTILSDNATTVKARGAVASCLSVIVMLCCYDLEKTKEAIKALEDTFRLGYGKGENSPSVSPEQSWLMSQALAGWCLLLTVAPNYEVQTHINNHLGRLQQLLQSSDVDLRMTAGEAIALMYELARDTDEDFEHESEDSLCELLKNLATDSVKHRAKKDRRQQRSCFRDVQRFVVDGEPPTETVKIGKENLLELECWSQKRQYDSFCHLLQSGTSVHLRNSQLLRGIFDLGPPGQDGYSSTRGLSKAQRTFYNAAAFKARTKARAKHRDKRSAVIA